MACPRLGLITYASGNDPLHTTMMDRVVAGLARRGFTEPDGICFQRYYGERDKVQLEKAAANLAIWQPRLVVSLMTNSDIATLGATQALGTPVLCWSMDPVDSGLVGSMSRPGGRLSGVAFPPGFALMQLRALRILKPDAAHLGYLHNPGYAPANGALAKMQDAARLTGMTLEVREASDRDAVVAAISNLRRNGADALAVGPHELFNLNGGLIGRTALNEGLPALGQESVAEGGGVLGFAPDFPRILEAIADMAARILHGAMPGEMPIDRHIMPRMTLNLASAASLGLVVPAPLIDEAQRIIQ